MDTLTTSNTRRRRTPLALAALAAMFSLALASSLAPSPAHAAPGFGDVTVSVVGPSGEQLGVVVNLIPAGATSYHDANRVDGSGVAPTVSAPVGGYGLVAVAPWGGLFCVGVSPCNAAVLTAGGLPITVAPAIQVTDEGQVSHRIDAPAPAQIAGANVLGSSRRVEFSQPMTDLRSLFQVDAAGVVVIQWLRDGAPIPGSDQPTHAIGPDDVGKVLSARLSWAGPLAAFLATSGIPMAPRDLAGLMVEKARTKTTVQVFRNRFEAGRNPGLRVDVTYGEAPVPGRVRITVGKRKMTKTLRNGTTRAVLPATLKPGRHKVVATYLGTSAYAGSTGKDKVKVLPRRP